MFCSLGCRILESRLSIEIESPDDAVSDCSIGIHKGHDNSRLNRYLLLEYPPVSFSINVQRGDYFIGPK